MKPMLLSLRCCCLTLLTLSTAHAGLGDFFDKLKDSIKQDDSDTPAAASSTTQDMVVAGLKQALDQGVNKAVATLGRDNGFLNDPSVRIPMPDSLSKVEKGLRKIGKDKYADQFISTMNRAAEQAVPKTTDILIQAIKAMTLQDALGILKGDQDAATQYFKRTSGPHLQQAIKPLVTEATDSVGLTQSYKKMIGKAGFLANYVDKDSLDIDQYITDKAVDGLFVKIAEEEKLIRENPAARTTELLQNVFGDLMK